MTRSLHLDRSKISRDTPQFTPFAKSWIDWHFLLITKKNVLRRFLKIINISKINFWIPIVDGWINNHCPHCGADEVVM